MGCLELWTSRNTTEGLLWYNKSRFYGCSDSILMPICRYTQSTARRFSTGSEESSSETDKKDHNPDLMNTVLASAPNASTELVESRGSGSRSNMEGTISNEKTRFVRTIEECWNEKSRKFKNLYQVIFAEETLQMAYKEVSKKKGSLTPGDDARQKLGEIHLNTFKNMSDRLFKSHYKFAASRKVLIPKKSTKEKRFLTITSSWDKIVTYSIYMVLRHVYENFCNNMPIKKCKNNKKAKKQEVAKPFFLSASHGFRPGKSCHTALNNVQT